jgi:hypothetical protein
MLARESTNETTENSLNDLKNKQMAVATHSKNEPLGMGSDG